MVLVIFLFLVVFAVIYIGTKAKNKNQEQTNEITNNTSEPIKVKLNTIIIIGVICAVILIMPVMIFYISKNRSKPVQSVKTVVNTISEEEKIQQSLERQKVEQAITDFAEIVRNANQGSVKYYSYSTYKNTADGNKIYKIVYSTASDSGKMYSSRYHQLVSLNEEMTEVVKSSKLYSVLYKNGSPTSSSNYEMEWEAEQIWGIK